MKAKTKANQSNLNKAISWLSKYNAFNIQRDLVEDEQGDDTTAWRRINKKCEDSFDKYLDYCYYLPKYEVTRIEKSELY
jgi:hypothetical protein